MARLHVAEGRAAVAAGRWDVAAAAAAACADHDAAGAELLLAHVNLATNDPNDAAAHAESAPELAALGITAREADVLRLIGAGLGNRAIADRLYLSVRTVEKHVERLTLKAATNRAGLVALARRAVLTA